MDTIGYKSVDLEHEHGYINLCFASILPPERCKVSHL